MSARMECPIASLSEGTLRSFQVLGLFLNSQHLVCRGWSCYFQF
jgi:hypothetical protein